MSNKFKSEYLYPFVDPGEYDDDYGEGYSYALVAEEHPSECFIVDCWIVNEQGDKHPGIDCFSRIDQVKVFMSLRSRLAIRC